MQISQAIASLQQAGPLNVVWGAGCSYAGPNAATWLMFDLKVNCHIPIAGPHELHSAVMSLDRKTRQEKTARYGMSWAHICLAELLRAGRVARVLTGNFDNGIVNAVTALELLPEVYQDSHPELASSAIPGIYLLGESDPAAVAALIQRGAQTGPWLVIGCSGDHLGLREAVLGVPRFEHGLYWAGYFNQRLPAPLSREMFSASRNAYFLPGFDSDSFMAYLARGLGAVPAALLAASPASTGQAAGKPMDQLRLWCDAFAAAAQKTREGFSGAARSLLHKAETASGSEYDSLVADAIRQYELHFRCSPSGGYAAALFLGLLAEKRSPRRAASLRRKGLEWIDRFPAAPGMEAMQARQVAETYAHLARFRTGDEADRLFARAEEALPTEASSRFGAFLLDQCAEILCQWADQERNAKSDAVFERARRKFVETQRSHPDRRERLFRFAQALRQRAKALSGQRALELLAQARGAAGELVSEDPADLATWQLLGLIALLEAEKNQGDNGRLAEAEVFFRKALSLRADAAPSILQNWAAALAACAMSRSGAEAFELYGLAYEKFRESEQLKPDSRALHNNWSSALVHEARERRDAAELWLQARQQAEKAELIEPGSGSYNLACIAAELGDRDGVCGHLRRSAEFGQIPPLSQVLRDVNFAGVRDQLWFRQLLDEIFDCGLPD